MQQYAVVFFPKVDERLQTFRRKYDPHWDIIPPHITIVSPASNISEKQLLDHVNNASRDIAPYSIHLTGLTKTSDNCLFLLVKEGNEKIVHLHDRLYSGILNPYAPTNIPFVPHITLGEFRTKDDRFDKQGYEKAYSEAQDLHFDITCNFDAISIIKGDGINPARIIKTTNLHS